MEWLVADWRTLLPAAWAHIALTLTSILCGAIVGTEREKRDKPAGLRTMVLVCLGSAAFTMASYAFGTTTGDTGRVSAQIVTGIGFLGAGVILHGRTDVSGLTTAATVWAVAAAGMVVGTGYVGAGIGLSLAIRGVLTGMIWWEYKLSSDIPEAAVEIDVDPDHGKSHVRLKRLLYESHHRGRLETIGRGEGGTERIRLLLRLPMRQRLELLDELAKWPEVRVIREVAPVRSRPEAYKPGGDV
jgi:putative Mg2+ transporter-C (MgtC) family protein